MATLSKGTLFNPEIVSEIINGVKGKSSLAALAAQTPIPFNGLKEFVFTMDSEVNIVAENAAKSHGGITLTPKTIVPLKIEYGSRVSDEFMYAAEEEQIKILKPFIEGFARKAAKGLDLMALHGVNPRTMTASTVIGNKHFDAEVMQLISYDSTNPDANIEAAVQLVDGSEGDVTGAIFSKIFSAALADYKVNNVKQFPELAWGANPKSVNGLRVEINKTVSAAGSDRAIVGDFENAFRWGYAKEIPMEIIPYGDPDNSGEDLKGHGQVYLRAELYLGWGILNPASFARVVVPTSISVSSATADGTSSTTTSTKITITLSSDVVGLKAEHFTLEDGTGKAAPGALTGSGKNYVLALDSVTTQGSVTMKIADIGGFDFPTTGTSVTVHKST
ncbi:MAG: phage major capsid protein [Eubacteriales bacterium]|jgi:hypothetical protein